MFADFVLVFFLLFRYFSVWKLHCFFCSVQTSMKQFHVCSSPCFRPQNHWLQKDGFIRSMATPPWKSMPEWWCWPVYHEKMGRIHPISWVHHEIHEQKSSSPKCLPFLSTSSQVFPTFFPTPFSHVLPYVFPGVRRGDGQRPRPLRLHGDGGLDPEESGRPREKCLILILL